MEQSGQVRATVTNDAIHRPKYFGLHTGGSFISHSGFFHRFGKTPFEWPYGESRLRIYMNATELGKARIAGWTRSTLDHDQIPFELKIDILPSRCGRRDNTVLYVSHDDAKIVAKLIMKDGIQNSWFSKRVPPLTMQLFDGVSLAPDLYGISYGTYVSDLLSSSIGSLEGNLARIETEWECRYGYGDPTRVLQDLEQVNLSIRDGLEAVISELV